MARRKVPRYRANPFLEHTAEISNRGYKRIFGKDDNNKYLVVNPDGEARPAGFYFKREVEKNEFVKLFAEGVGALMGLNNAGKKVFQILYGQIVGEKGKDKTEIILNYELLTDEEREFISKRTFYNGINDLIRTGFIAESYVASYYFINPAYIFNGDRLAVVNEYVMKQNDQLEFVSASATDSFEAQLEANGQGKIFEENEQ